MAVAKFSRSIPDIFVDVVNQFTILVRKETQLARTEISEKLTDLAVRLGLLVGGSVLLIPALVILLQAAVAALVCPVARGERAHAERREQFLADLGQHRRVPLGVEDRVLETDRQELLAADFRRSLSCTIAFRADA